MSVVWCNERVLKLIELYQNYECLWDTSHREYKTKFKRQDAWDSIAKTLDVPVKEVESKVHTLRSQFTRERKKLKYSKKTETGSEPSPVSRVVNIKWFAYEPLLFLIKCETSGNEDTIDNHVEYNISTEPQNEETRADRTETITKTGTKVPKKRSHDEKMDDAYEVMKNIKKILDDREIMTDDFDVYGKYVASELRNIKDEYSTLIAKQYINNILIDARIGKYRQDFKNTGDLGTPGTSTKSNDGTSNQDSPKEIKDEVFVDFDFRNNRPHLHT